MKLIRRSVAQLLRDAGTKRAWSDDWRDYSQKVPIEEIELQLGHRRLENTSDLYARFNPEYVEHARNAVEGIVDAIIGLAPLAFTLPQYAKGSEGVGVSPNQGFTRLLSHRRYTGQSQTIPPPRPPQEL